VRNYEIAAVLAVATVLTAPQAHAQTATLASTISNNGVNKIVVDTFRQELATRLPSVKLEIFLDGTLGGERELIELVKIGETQFHFGVIHSAQYFAELDATLIPFLFTDYESIQVFLAGPVGDRIKQVLEARGNAKFLGTYFQGARWTTSNRPFRTLDELKGIKIRMPEIPLWINVWSGLGAVTTPMAAPEVFSGLQTGVIDAQENTLSGIHGRRLYEVQKALINTQHLQAYTTFMVNLDFWKKLNASGQKAVQDAADVALKTATAAAQAENEETVKSIVAAGLQRVEVSQEFRRAAMPVVERAARRQLAPGVYEEALKVIEAQAAKQGTR